MNCNCKHRSRCCNNKPKASTPAPEFTVCGRISTDEACNLIVFRANNVQSIRAVDVGGGIRGVEITSVPVTCGSFCAGAIDLSTTLFQDPTSPSQVPHVDPVSLDPHLVDLGNGTCQLVFIFLLLDSTTGLPRDPCEGNLAFTVWSFHTNCCVSGNGAGEFFTDASLPSPCGPVCPPPAPTGRATPSLTRDASGKPKKFGW